MNNGQIRRCTDRFLTVFAQCAAVLLALTRVISCGNQFSSEGELHSVGKTSTSNHTKLVEESRLHSDVINSEIPLIGTADDVPVHRPNQCLLPVRKSHFMLVSTMDGKISALDVTNNGRESWNVDTSSGPLLSASISKMELTRDGIQIRLIPSLDGGLYQYDGDSIEAVPFTAETLLSSSHRLSDNLVVVGGKELRTYGVEGSGGQVRYICTMDGCQYLGSDDVTDDEDIVMVTKTTQTVRAIDCRTGHEKWNFSVATHEVKFYPGQPNAIENEKNKDEDKDDDGISIETCYSSEENDGVNEIAEFDGILKVIVPTGVVMAVNKDNPNEILWQHKFKSPIANAWTLNKGQLKSVSLFTGEVVPALSEPDGSIGDNLQSEPLLYLGAYSGQVYVQPSVQSLDRLSGAAINDANSLQSSFLINVPKVSWRPYVATANSRTPAIHSNMNLLDYDDNPDAIVTRTNPWDTGPDSNIQAVWQNHYPYDTGYYLFPEQMSVLLDESKINPDMDDTVIVEYISVTLWNWWKEVAIISFITSIAVHLLIVRYFNKTIKIVTNFQEYDSETDDVKDTVTVQIDNQAQNGASQCAGFVSRYLDDFEHVHQFGKGGFGVVFEARHRMDGMNYAVKRIPLPNSDDAREKVMREVKALAKLDNVGIVRYYQAWLECPPVGWQEARDKEIEDSEWSSPTASPLINDNIPLMPQALILNPLKPFGGGLNSFIDASTHIPSKQGSTEEFSLHDDQTLDESNDDDDTESGSFSLCQGTPEREICNNDVDVEFVNSNTDRFNTRACKPKSIRRPFQSYKGVENVKIRDAPELEESNNIVFEDSGCSAKQADDDLGWNNNNNDASPQSISHHDNDNQDDASINTQTNFRIEREKSSSASTANDLKLNKSILHCNSKQAVPKLFLYIQMQLCQKETLKDWLNSNTLNRDRGMVLDIFDQIVTAVEYVHDCNLMHRDLKPSNIFFAVDNAVKIGDFGLVTAMNEQMAEEQVCLSSIEAGDKHHTAQVGTQLYMSPEQIAGKNYSHKVDIYSLGMILFELFYPFATQMERVNTLIGVKKQIFPERFIREMPSEQQFVNWLVSHQPDERPSAREILDSSLLKPFESSRGNPRHRHRSRSRTISNSSTG